MVQMIALNVVRINNWTTLLYVIPERGIDWLEITSITVTLVDCSGSAVKTEQNGESGTKPATERQTFQTCIKIIRVHITIVFHRDSFNWRLSLDSLIVCEN